METQAALGYPMVNSLLASQPLVRTGAEHIEIEARTTHDFPINLQYYEAHGLPSTEPFSVGSLVTFTGMKGGTVKLTSISFINPAIGWVLYNARVIIIPVIPSQFAQTGVTSVENIGPMRHLRMFIPMTDYPAVHAYFAAPIVNCSLSASIVQALTCFNPTFFEDEEVRRYMRSYQYDEERRNKRTEGKKAKPTSPPLSERSLTPVLPDAQDPADISKTSTPSITSVCETPAPISGELINTITHI